MTISTSVRTFVDTNVFIYAVDEDDPVKRDIATELVKKLGPSNLRLSAQVMAEFFVVATRKLKSPMPAAEAAEAVSELARLKPVPVSPELVNSAIELSREAELSLWDCMIVCAAAEAGCSQLATEDLADGTELLGVRIANPFAG